MISNRVILSLKTGVCSWQGETKVRRAGQCCDECAAARGSCLYQGIVRYHGDMWNASGCEFCTCSRGQVLCHKAECARLRCPQVNVLFLKFCGGCEEECLMFRIVRPWQRSAGLRCMASMSLASQINFHHCRSRCVTLLIVFKKCVQRDEIS